MANFYQENSPNGYKSFDLGMLVELQIRTNRKCDPDPEVFGKDVWETLDANTKTKVQEAAKANPPNRASIGDMIYTPTRSILEKGPYFIPNIILDTFTTIKAPEVIEWVVFTQK